MRAIVRQVARLLLLAAVLVPLAGQAQGGPGPGAGGCPGCDRTGRPGARAFDPASITTVQGRVQEVQRVERGRREGVHLVLAVGSEQLAVRLGPASYLDHQPLTLAAGDAVEVKGSKTTVGGRSVLVAQEVRRGDQVLALRDAAGLPLWRGQGQGRR